VFSFFFSCFGCWGTTCWKSIYKNIFNHNCFYN
jgi:hypothetical protein